MEYELDAEAMEGLTEQQQNYVKREIIGLVKEEELSDYSSDNEETVSFLD